ncbi:DUF1707 domain-containing protein [Geodermatophilus sp. DSM 44513]|uniref:DUF1707 SHOCT-like domain-containing protein n=1 Tax=Geodermatophilus sp. DSM 44513 TaxID=1528104 RepID=UPI001279AA35|nr:DUF1707 domain-containing protein [Geodermatophilus sp. DSM 44513]WNV75707.1 DUF1707 domain-containing protein [Geodermatophilus sp. DSM 44513]
MPEPHLRAADADRSAVAARLGDQMSAGRLTVAEYDERLARAYAARTYGELAALTEDLPLPAVQARSATPVVRTGCGGGSLEAARRSWAVTAVVVLAVWTLTSIAQADLQYFWPFWVIGPWGAVLLAQTLARGRGRQPLS